MLKEVLEAGGTGYQMVTLIDQSNNWTACPVPVKLEEIITKTLNALKPQL